MGVGSSCSQLKKTEIHCISHCLSSEEADILDVQTGQIQPYLLGYVIHVMRYGLLSHMLTGDPAQLAHSCILIRASCMPIVLLDTVEFFLWLEKALWVCRQGF